MKQRYIQIVILSFLLASCAGQQSRSGRSDQPSPPLRSGQAPYTVYGKRYEPLSSHAGFEQEGIASSYGKEFHGRSTSSGEKFDMNALTAAHKTLPLGVYVRIVHQRTGNEVTVRINDRGPFVRDRIVDLSQAAAQKLGMLREGLAPVKISALGYKNEGQYHEKASYRPPVSYDTGAFTLQVGAFTVRANAHRYADNLQRIHGLSDVQETVIGGTKYFRVRLGRFSSLKVAQAAQKTYEQNGFPGCFVVALN